jgi:hypothetical protein
MNIFSLSRNATLALCVAALGGSFLASSAHAIAILSFGQSGSGSSVVGTQSGTSTTIIATDAPITVSQIDAAPATPLSAFLSMDFTSTSAAISILGSLEEHFSGVFSITSGLNGGGINYLSGTLIDIAFGSNAAFNLNGSTPPSGNVTFTSDAIPGFDLGLDRGVGFSFANVFPLLAITNNTFSSFTSSASGTFSGSVQTASSVPEPVGAALLGIGMIGIGVIRHRRAKPQTV